MNITQIALYRRLSVFEISRFNCAHRPPWLTTLGGLLLVLLLACGPQLARASLLTPAEVAQLEDSGFLDTLRENLNPNYDFAAVTREQFIEDVRLVTLILSGVVDALKEKIDPNYDIRNVSPEQLRADLLQLTLIEAGLEDALDDLFDPNADFTDFSFEEFQQQIDNLDDLIPGEGGGDDDGGGTVATPLPAAWWLFVSAVGGLFWKGRRGSIARDVGGRAG